MTFFLKKMINRVLILALLMLFGVNTSFQGFAQDNQKNNVLNADVKVDTTLHWETTYDYTKRAKRNTKRMLKVDFLRIASVAVQKNIEELTYEIPELIYEQKVANYFSF